MQHIALESHFLAVQVVASEVQMDCQLKVPVNFKQWYYLRPRDSRKLLQNS